MLGVRLQRANGKTPSISQVEQSTGKNTQPSPGEQGLIFTCGEAISDERRRSTSRFFPSPSPIIKFWHIMPILGCTRTTQEYLVTSREIWLPGKFDFPEI